MSIVLIAVVYNLIIALNYVLAPWIDDWGIHSRTAVIVTMQVLLMTYLVMPRVTHYVKRVALCLIALSRRSMQTGSPRRSAQLAQQPSQATTLTRNLIRY